jgi:hypothetical protein
MVADISQCSLDASIALRRILSGELKDGIHDDLPNPRPANSLPLVAEIKLLRDEFAVSAEHCVWSKNGRQFQQSLATNRMDLHCEESTLIIIQQQTLLSEFLQQCFYLRILELDDLLLTFIDAANEDGKQTVAGLEYKLHRKLGRGQ